MKKFNLKQGLTIAVAFMAIAFVSGITKDAQAYKRQSNKEKSVRVDVLPVELSVGEPVKFEIRMNSHSVTLNSDIVTGSILEDDTGAQYKALNWDGTPPGSHHRSGTLEFPALKGNPKSVTLFIKGVSNVPKRTYKWVLE
jgi:hypothetical protein